MKQNSSILFHDMRNTLTKSYLRYCNFAALSAFFAVFGWLNANCPATDRPEYYASFDPAKGFKPAQTDLTEIFLQIAGSLEYYGSPEPYLRHMKSEHARIEAKYRERFGTLPKSYCPAYMTDAYLDHFTANWNVLSAKLGLEATVKDIGNLMRDAILGTRRTGTTIVEIFNQHQVQVFNKMAGKPSEETDFLALKTRLITQLELDKTSVDDSKYEVARRDASRSAIIIHGVTMKLFARLDQNLKPADAVKIKGALTGVFIDVGQMAQSELEVGIAQWALSQPSTASK